MLIGLIKGLSENRIEEEVLGYGDGDTLNKKLEQEKEQEKTKTGGAHWIE